MEKLSLDQDSPKEMTAMASRRQPKTDVIESLTCECKFGQDKPVQSSWNVDFFQNGFGLFDILIDLTNLRSKLKAGNLHPDRGRILGPQGTWMIFKKHKQTRVRRRAMENEAILTLNGDSSC